MPASRSILLFLLWAVVAGCSFSPEPVTVAKPVSVVLSEGIDTSAGGADSGEIQAYIVTTPSATYYLDKNGGGLSSMLDTDGVDWLGFHNKKGSGWKGEYRGFPNAIHKQDGNYFHAVKDGTEMSSSVVTINAADHVQIVFTTANKKWRGQWDFYPDRCDFTMTQVSKGFHYWVLYEGVPNGAMDPTDFWYSSADKDTHLIADTLAGDLPYPEWIAFGDAASSRMLYLLNRSDDNHPDEFVSRPYMTVFGFGRSGKGKFIDSPQRFSLGFVETTSYSKIESKIDQLVAQ